MTELCGTCGVSAFDVSWGEGGKEFYYGGDGQAYHVACKPREGIDDMPIATGFVQKHAGPKDGPYFGFDLCPNPAEHPNDPNDWKVGAAHDTLYSYKRRDRGPDVILNKYIEVTYAPNEADGGKVFLNVESWREVAAPEGQPSPEKVEATVSASETTKNENIHRSVALQQAVAFVVGSNAGAGTFMVEDAFYTFLSLLDGTHKVTREAGEAPSGGTMKPVADQNPARNEEGYVVRAGDADRNSQDATNPDPAYVSG